MVRGRFLSNPGHPQRQNGASTRGDPAARNIGFRAIQMATIHPRHPSSRHRDVLESRSIKHSLRKPSFLPGPPRKSDPTNRLALLIVFLIAANLNSISRALISSHFSAKWFQTDSTPPSCGKTVGFDIARRYVPPAPGSPDLPSFPPAFRHPPLAGFLHLLTSQPLSPEHPRKP